VRVSVRWFIPTSWVVGHSSMSSRANSIHHSLLLNISIWNVANRTDVRNCGVLSVRGELYADPRAVPDPRRALSTSDQDRGHNSWPSGTWIIPIGITPIGAGLHGIAEERT
jgi:hypothetical protein